MLGCPSESSTLVSKGESLRPALEWETITAVHDADLFWYLMLSTFFPPLISLSCFFCISFFWRGGALVHSERLMEEGIVEEERGQREMG